MIRKVITFYPVRSSDNSGGLCGPILDEAIARISSEDGPVTARVDGIDVVPGGIPSLALKKKTHGASAVLLIVGSMSTLRLVRLRAGRSAVAGAKCMTRVTD
jgi:hypothetical protein